MPSTSVIKAIGWAIRPGERIAHYFHASPRGLVALSMCGLVNKPEELRPASGQDNCPGCKAHIAIQEMKEEHEPKDTYDNSPTRSCTIVH